jgi:hypothetical protein
MTSDGEMAEIAAGLSEVQRDFLSRVASGRPLKLAGRAEDRARQSLRRAGLVTVLKAPRRWAVTDLGDAVSRALAG